MEKKLFCHICNEKVDYEIREEKFSYNVRNTEFEVRGKRAFCKIHPNEELFHREYDTENQQNAFNQYREKYDIVSPDEIRTTREKYKLTQREFSHLLGFGEITISRYERGSLPTLAQNQIIKDSMDPRKMMNLLDKNKKKIDAKKAEELTSLLKDYSHNSHYEEEIINEIKGVFHHKPDIYNGFKPFDFEKFSNMVLYFAKKERPYLTKLNKLMFYADYYFFKKYNLSISGAKYVRYPYGPVPEKYQTLYDNMPTIEIFENEYGCYAYPTMEKFELDLFEEQELEVLDFVYEKFRNMYAGEIKDFSHEEKCWLEVPNKEEIPYSYAKDLDIYREFKRA